MTIGEKIKYCRKQIGITQDKLAELTGIHPVSIRKYETNKMQPQPPQLEKIAAGDDGLSARRMFDDIALPGAVQFAQNVIEQQNRVFAAVTEKHLAFGKLHGERRRPGLAL